MRTLDPGRATPLARAARRRSPATFLILVVVVSAPFWVVGALLPGARVVGLPISAAQFVAPLVAAVVLVVREDGWPAAVVLVRRGLAFTSVRPRRLYVAVLAALPAVYVASWLVQRAAGRPVPGLGVAVVPLLVVVVLFLVTALAEEIGWTGYAAERLIPGRSLLATGIGLGLAWAVIHVVPDIQNGHDAGWILFHRLGSVGLRVLLVTVFAASGGNLAAAVLMHATDNISWATVTAEGAGYDPAITGTLVLLAGLIAVELARRAQPPEPRRDMGRAIA